MVRRPVPLALLLVLLVGFLTSQLAAQRGSTASLAVKSTAQIAAQAAPAVVTVTTRDKAGKEIALGSGFVVRPEGVVITNWHVMAGAAAATVTLATGESFSKVLFLDGDEDADIAILKIPGFGLPTLSAVADIPPIGSKVVALGSPRGLEGTVSEGIVSAVRVVDGRQWIQITAPISPGSSGGAVLNAGGSVFAISTLTIKDGQQLNFAVPVKYAMGLVGSGATGRPVEEVFASKSDTSHSVIPEPPTGPGANPRANPTSLPAAAPKPSPTQNPVRSMAGTYLLTFHTGAHAILVSANETAGLFAFLADNGTVDRVETLRTTSTGEVAASFGGLASGGFQTDNGFWASGTYIENDSDGSRKQSTFSYSAERYSPPISVDTGVYHVKCRTAYRKGSYDGTVGDWEGEAAIVTKNDKIYISLLLRNASGGDTGMTSSGPIDSVGRFALQAGGTQLVGSVRAGALSAQWTDQRDNGAAFFGPLTGQRVAR